MKRKILGLLFIFVVLVGITGCGKKEEEEEGLYPEEVSEAEQKVYKENCDKAAQNAYDLYKTKYSRKLIEGVCSNTSNSHITITFKAGDKVFYRFTYNVDDDTVDHNEQIYSTENYEEQCESLPEDQRGLFCATQKLIISGYDTEVSLTNKDHPYSYQYWMIDTSKLK
jgi:PDZ domain-containing secreted protein